jgi:hypothetical protein
MPTHTLRIYMNTNNYKGYKHHINNPAVKEMIEKLIARFEF